VVVGFESVQPVEKTGLKAGRLDPAARFHEMARSPPGRSVISR
jgi:hypothetical protein